MRLAFLWLAGIVLGISAVCAQDALKSGPQPGAILPGPFDAFNINGKIAEDRQHCLICQNGLNPAVLVFAREPQDASAKSFDLLLTKLDKAVDDHKESYLGAFAVFLSPDARSSVNTEPETDTEKLLDEATKRLALIARLKTRAGSLENLRPEPLKNAVVAAFPEEGPKAYKVDPKAEVTVIFYEKLKVVANWSFAAGKLTDKDVDEIIAKVDATLAAARKKKKL